MIKITTLNDYSFKLEAFGEVQIKPKGYENYVSSNKLQISSKFDSDDILVPYTSFEQYTVDNVVFSNILDLQIALSAVLFNSASFSGANNETLKHFIYNPVTDKLEADRAIETTLNSLFLGEQHKMSSGAENIFFTNLSTNTNYYSMKGGLKDQSITANQGSSGFIPPTGRVYTDMFSIPLGGNIDNASSIGYSGGNYFGVNIAGLGITTVAAEQVEVGISLEYTLQVNGKKVYKQILNRDAALTRADKTIYPNDTIEWFFDHPVEILAGTTIFAEIRKIDRTTDEDFGVFQVRQGDEIQADGGYRYQAIVHNRLFEDKDLELISPYAKYKAMDFGLEATSSTVLLRDLSLTIDSLLVPHAVNTLEAIANGTEIQIKVKGGAKIIIESLPVSGCSINGSFVNSVLNQAVVQLNSLFTNTEGFASGGGNPVTTFALVANDLTIGLEDSTSFTVDVTTLGVDENNFVSSGALVGSNLVLTMDDASTVTIDAANMINGAALTAVNDSWYYSYGTYANQEVTVPYNNGTIAPNNAPFYFGQVMNRGSEFRWNMRNLSNFDIGIWDGAEVAVGYGLGAIDDANWLTAFNFNGGFQDGTNTDLLATQFHASKYAVAHDTPVVIRFGLDGHLTLVDLLPTPEVVIAKTQTALTLQSFNMQLGLWVNNEFPNGSVKDAGWEIVHDFDGSENGIYDGIKDHTVLRSGVTVVAGEKIMFDLDRIGSGEFFGTLYTGAASGNSTAETQLTNSFEYKTNEAVTLGNNWTANTAAANYFLTGGLHSWRVGGSNNTQGMFSIRFQLNNVVELWSETENELVATSLLAGNTTLGFYMGSDEVMTYAEIPTVTKQLIIQGTQPNAQFAPTVANQTVTVIENEVLNFTIIDSDNIVNQYVEVDAPSWMTINQVTGVLTGTAPAFAGTAADTIIVACKAGNAIGGTIDFTVTVTIASYASTNTKSLEFGGGSKSLQGPHANITALQRAGNGSGASDAWTISMWIKPGNSSNVQTLFYYGGDDLANEGRIEISQFSVNSIMFRYGSTNNNLTYFGVSSFPYGQWNQIVITYDGGTTGSASGDIQDYVSRFSMYVNGSLAANNIQHNNYGWDGTIIADKFRIGRLLGATTSQYMLGGRINQLAIWGTDEEANIATIYNGGVAQDLSLLASTPEHYYEIENSITTINDKIGNAHLTGYNFVSSDLVTDSPT